MKIMDFTLHTEREMKPKARAILKHCKAYIVGAGSDENNIIPINEWYANNFYSIGVLYFRTSVWEIKPKIFEVSIKSDKSRDTKRFPRVENFNRYLEIGFLGAIYANMLEDSSDELVRKAYKTYFPDVNFDFVEELFHAEMN
ncbi:MAG: hypothetical protein QXL94_05580 [Candidatus Parvarchaeum sp.]